MKAYVINLREAVKRRKAVTAMLLRLAIPFEIFEAVNGRALNGEQLAQLVDLREVEKYPAWLTPGMLGAALSHLEVYRRIATATDEVALVLEDDIVLRNETKVLLSFVMQHPSFIADKLLFLYLVNHRKPIRLSANSKMAIDRETTLYQVPELKGVGGAGGYLIHRDVARRFVAVIDKIKVAPDTWHYFHSLGIYDEIWCTYPFLGQPGLFESTIGYVQNKYVNAVKSWVERHEVPFLHSLLQRNRKRIWEKTSRVELI